MKKFCALLFVSAVVVHALLAAPFSFSNSSAEVVASVTVDGKTETVTRQEVDAKLAEYKAGGLNATESEIIEVLVNDRVFLMSAERDKVRVSDSEVEERLQQVRNQLEMTYGQKVSDADFNAYLSASLGGVSVDEYKEQLREQLLVDKYVRTKKSAELDKVVIVSDDEVKSFYRKNKSSFVTPEYVRVSHVFRKKAENEIENAKIKRDLVKTLEDINAGRLSFEKAVSQYSEDESSKQRGGDIGNVVASLSEQLGDPFIDVVFSLEPGEVGKDVVESPVGYHIVKTVFHSEQKFLAIDDYVSPDSSMTVREYIKNGLQQQESQKNYADVVNSFVEDLKKSAKITYSSGK